MDLNTEDTDMRRALRFAAQGYAVPEIADFSWVDQYVATATEEAGLGILLRTNGYVGDRVSSLVQSLPSPPFTVELLGSFNPLLRNFFNCGLILRDSATGRTINTGCFGSSNALASQRFTNNTFNVTGHFFSDVASHLPPRGIRIVDDNVDQTCYITFDTETWIEFGSASRTAWLANTDQAGIYINGVGSAFTTYQGSILVNGFRVY